MLTTNALAPHQVQHVGPVSVCLLDECDVIVPLMGSVVMRIPRVRLRVEVGNDALVIYVSERTHALGYTFGLRKTGHDVLLEVSPAS